MAIKNFSKSVGWIASRPLVAFLMSFLILLIFNLDRMLDPPYWDGIGGIYSQGIWLKNNGFSILKLLDQPHVDYGGPRANIFLIWPLFYGLLVTYLNPPATFFILHLVNIAFAALAIVIFYHLIYRKGDQSLVLIWILAGVLNPIWSGQIAGIYVDLPLATVIGVCLLFIRKQRYGTASLICLLGFFIKPSVIIFSLALLITAIVVFVLKWEPFREIGPLFLPFPAIFLLSRVDFYPLEVNWQLFQSIRIFCGLTPTFFPSLIIQAGLVFLLTIFMPLKIPFMDKRIDPREKITLLVAWLFVYGFLLSFTLYSWVMPRYFVMIVFPLIYLLTRLISSQRGVMVLGLLALLYGSFNQQGQLLPALPLHQARTGNFLERSREYLKDLDGNRAVCQYLERNHSDHPILTKEPFTQMLTLPDLGYIKKAHSHIVNRGRYPLITGAHRTIRTLKLSHPKPPLAIYCTNSAENDPQSTLMPQSNDILLFEETSLPGNLIIYQKSTLNN